MEFADPPKSCAACETDVAPRLIEEYRDRIGAKDYRILSCSQCGVCFSEPREAVGADWYAQAGPLRLEAFTLDPEGDWRFSNFLEEPLVPGRLLDVGCGDGGFLRLAQDRGWSVTGFDYDERVISAARAAGLRDVSANEFLRFIRSRRDGEFDAVTLFDVLEHTPEPLRFMEEVRRVLAPGGHVAVTLPNALRPMPWGREEHDYPPHHFTRWTPEALSGFLTRTGFRIIRLSDTYLPVYYLAEHMFYFGIMRRLLPGLKHVLFGAVRQGATVTEIYATGAGTRGLAGMLRSKRVRHRLVETFKMVLKAGLYPAAGLMTAYYRFTRKECGEHLYTLAKFD